MMPPKPASAKSFSVKSAVQEKPVKTWVASPSVPIDVPRWIRGRTSFCFQSVGGIRTEGIEKDGDLRKDAVFPVGAALDRSRGAEAQLIEDPILRISGCRDLGDVDQQCRQHDTQATHCQVAIKMSPSAVLLIPDNRQTRKS